MTTPVSLLSTPTFSTPPIPHPHSPLTFHFRQISLHAVPSQSRSSSSPSTLHCKKIHQLHQPYPFHSFNMSSPRWPAPYQLPLKTLSHQLPLKTLSHQLPLKALSHQLPLKTLSHQLPLKTLSHQLPLKTLSHQLPLKTLSHQLPLKTLSHQLPLSAHPFFACLFFSVPEFISPSYSHKLLLLFFCHNHGL